MILKKYGSTEKIKEENLVLKFENFNDVKENFSQASQDIFVLSCLNGKKNGTFVDLGCSKPIEWNNTFLLEKQFNWRGLAIDIEEDLVNQWDDKRNCKTICADCTKIDLLEHCSFLGNHIDYLSLDLEPASVTLECLKKISFNKIEFSLITFEHDFYRFGEDFVCLSRQILNNNGYKLICSNIKDQNNCFEDWYYNPKYISYEKIKVLESNNKEWYNILYR